MSGRIGAVRLSEVELCYRLAKQRFTSFKEYAIHWLKRSLAYEELWALQGVSLDVAPGERVGIVGHNGAGKSTLLKIVSGVLEPTSGTVAVSGRLTPLLELGTGFDTELTGRENVYLNALLLGRTRREIDERFDEIVEFSGLGDFIRAPIRNYSTGMVARLGFAVATAWVPDILVLDEVLSVGDVSFRRRCEERLAGFHERGTTLLLVSHSMQAIRNNCDRCLWIDHGRIRAGGAVEEVLDLYEPSDSDAGPDSVPESPVVISDEPLEPSTTDR